MGKNLKIFFFVFTACTLIFIIYNSSKTVNNSSIEKAYLKINLDVYKNTTLKEYIDLHNKQVELKQGSEYYGRKISLNKSPNAGYANRLYSFLTSLLTGILTDSAILVAWNFGSSENIGKYIDTPFENIFISNQKYNEIRNSSPGLVLKPIQS